MWPIQLTPVAYEKVSETGEKADNKSESSSTSEEKIASADLFSAHDFDLNIDLGIVPGKTGLQLGKSSAIVFSWFALLLAR